MYLLFALTLVPLGAQTFVETPDVEKLVEQTAASHPEVVDKINALDHELSDDEFLGMFPDHRLEGAHLSHDTWVHWLYALAAIIAFVGAIRLLFEPGQSTVMQLVLIGAITGTVGIVSLLLFQWIAEFSQGFWLRGGSIIVVIFYIVKFIGFSYHAAMDPSNGFLLSFFGFTCGVGLCEELTKLLPVVILQEKHPKLGWAGACALGLASGVGFGVAEGIMYSSDYYNGFLTWPIYATRFISCVALHATWAAAASIMAGQRRAALDAAEGGEWVKQILLLLAVPAVLHGLYDTLLKRDMNAGALTIAVASFVWLAIAIERARSQEAAASVQRLAAKTPAMH